jgi:hypothetical protein
MQQVAQVDNPKLNKTMVLAATFHVFSHINKRINELVESNILNLSERFSSLAGEVNSLEENNISVDSKSKMKEDISSALVSIQFQDRTSQNLEAMRKVSEYINDEIEDDSQDTQPDEMASRIIELLTLGELKEDFCNYLLEKGAIDNFADLGYNQVVTKENDEVELF